MEQVRKNIIKIVAQSLIITISLLAVILMGSSDIALVSPQDENSAKAKELYSGCLLTEKICFSNNDGSMTEDEPVGSGKTLFLTIPAVITICNFDNSRPVAKVIELKEAPKTDLRRYESLTTTASISSEKALEFTLVGAKPSGTS